MPPVPAPRTMMASPEIKEEPSGPLGRVLNILSDTAAVKGAMSGLAQIGQSVGTGLKYLGGRTGSESLAKLGEETQKGWVDIGKDYEAPEDIKGNVIDKPELLSNPSWLVYNLAQTGVSMLPGMVAGAGVGGAAAKGIQILGKMYKWTPKLAKRLMALGYALPAGVVGGAQEGTSTYEEVIKRGGTEQEAARAMEAMTTASGILNAISFRKIFEKLPQNQKSKVVNYIRKFIETGATEATTEYLEEPAEILIKMGLTKRGMTAEELKNQLKQGANVLLPSFIVGGGSGIAAPSAVRDDGNQGLPGREKPPVPEQESETFTGESDISSGENKSEAAAEGQKPVGDINERHESNEKQVTEEDSGDSGIAEMLEELNADADELLGKEENAEVKTLREDIARLENAMEKNAHFNGAPIYDIWAKALNNKKARLNDLIIDKIGESDKIIHKEKGEEYERINDAIPEMVSGETEANFGEAVADLRGTAQQKRYSPEELSTEPENFLKTVDEAQTIERNRRVNYPYRKKVSEMTPDERAIALLTDHLTGQKNKRAYQESKRLPFQVSIDVDDLKYVNDTFGHEAGNALLKKVGDALNRASEGKNNYHFHGDEFALEGNSDKELNAIIKKAKEILKSEPLEFNGEKYTPDFSHGIAETMESADKAMLENKASRKIERGKKKQSVRQEKVNLTERPHQKRKEKINKSLPVESGAQNAAQSLIKAGKVRLGKDFTTKTGTAWERAHGTRSKDQSREIGIVSQVTSKNGKMSMDEAAAFLNGEGFVSRTGEPWTDDSLYQEMAYGDLRNILHPDHAERIIEHKIREKENDWIEEQIDRLEREKSLTGNEIHPQDDILSDIAAEGNLTEEQYQAARDEIISFFDEIGKTDESVRVESTTSGEQSTLTGMSAAETFSLANPETDWSKSKPIQQQTTPKNAGLFNEEEKQFVESPDGGIDFGQIPKELEEKSDGKYPAAPIRLEKGSYAYGHEHITEERKREIVDAGYKNELDMLSDVSKNYTQIYEQPNGRLLLVKKNGKSKYAVVELQKEPDNYYGATTWFLDEKTERGKPYEERSGRKLLLEVAPATDSGKSAPFVSASNKDRAGENWRSGESSLPTPANTIAPEDESVKTKEIDDFGEKIGGARKDTAERGYAMSGKTESNNDNQPAWAKRYKIAESVTNPGTWTILDTKSRFGGSKQTFSSEEEAKKAIPVFAVAEFHRVYQSRENNDKWSVYKKVGKRKLFKVVNQDFPSREEGMKYMSEHAEEILNIKTSFGEEMLPVPEIVIRTGIERRQGDATPEMFMETFAPRGIEFGNWNNQDERQQVLNHAYDGLLDLADALNVPPKALMLNGELAIAFGARGQGLSGARAHYERDYGVINLTKMKGAGSLAHEIFHAMDHYFARLDTKAKSEKITNKRGDVVFPASSTRNDYQSHGASYKSQLRPELQAAYKNLMETMYNKAEQYVEDTKLADEFVGKAREALRDELGKVRKYLERDLVKEYGNYRKNKKGLHPASAEQLAEFDRLANKLIEGGDLETRHYANENARSKWPIGGRYSNDTLEAINAIYKAVRNRTGFSAERGGTLDVVRSYMKIYATRLKMFEDAKAGTKKTKKVPTNYAIEAKKMDQARTSDYWSEPHEMAARAFSSFIEDRIAEQGGQSDFLVYRAHGGILLPMIDGFIARPYPEGDERVAINQAFQKFIETLKIRETERGIAFFLRRDISKKEAVDNNIRWWENRDWEKELLALPKEYWHGKTRDFIAEGYIPITRSEADNLYKEDLGEFVSWVQVRGDETTWLEGIFIKPLRYKGYEPYYYKEETHYRNKAAYRIYQEFRDRYRNSLRNIPGKIDVPEGRDSSAIREEADREEIKQTRVADRGEEYGKTRDDIHVSSAAERSTITDAMREERERKVGAERQILGADDKTPKILRDACKQGQGIKHYPEGYDHPEFENLNNTATSYGLDLIPITDTTGVINGYIRDESIYLNMDDSSKDNTPLIKSLHHEIAHYIRNTPIGKLNRRNIDLNSKAFRQYYSILFDLNGGNITQVDALEEFTADLESGMTEHFGVNLLNGIKKDKRIITVSDREKPADKKEINEEPARAPPDDKPRFLWKEADGLTDRQKEVRSRIERNLQKFGKAAQKAGLPLGDYLKKKGMPETQIKRLLNYAKEQQVEYEGYREAGPDEILPSGAEIKIDFISGKTFVKIKRTTGIKNAVVNAERKDEGNDPIAKQGRQGNETMLQSAKEAVDSGVLDPRLLADEIISSPRPITTEEEFALMYDRMRIKNVLEDIRSKINIARKEGDAQEENDLIAKRTLYENYLDKNSAATTHAGTEVARSLQARVRMIAEDYSLEEILRKAREDNGGSLSEEMRQKYEALAKEIEEANKKIKAYEERIAALEAKRAFQKIKNDSIIERHLLQSPAKRGAAKEKLDREFSVLTKRLNSALGGLHFNFDPTAVKILGQMARNRIMAGAITPDSIVNEIYDQIHASYPASMGPRLFRRGNDAGTAKGRHARLGPSMGPRLFRRGNRNWCARPACCSASMGPRLFRRGNLS